MVVHTPIPTYYRESSVSFCAEWLQARFDLVIDTASLRRHDFNIGYLSDPTCSPLFTRHNDPQWTFHRSKRVPLAAVREQNHPVGKPGVEFGEREDRGVTIAGFHQDIHSHFRAAQFVPQGRARPAQQFDYRDALVNFSGIVFVRNGQASMR